MKKILIPIESGIASSSGNWKKIIRFLCVYECIIGHPQGFWGALVPVSQVSSNISKLREIWFWIFHFSHLCNGDLETYEVLVGLLVKEKPLQEQQTYFLEQIEHQG